MMMVMSVILTRGGGGKEEAYGGIQAIWERRGRDGMEGISMA